MYCIKKYELLIYHYPYNKKNNEILTLTLLKSQTALDLHN